MAFQLSESHRGLGLFGVLALLIPQAAMAVDSPANFKPTAPSAIIAVELSKAEPVDAVPQSNAARDRLFAAYPGVQSTAWRGRVMSFFGKAMTGGGTPAQAADAFLIRHAEAFGAGRVDVRLVRTATLSGDRFAAFVYDQYMDGLPVDFGRMTIVVRTTPDQPWSEINNRVVLATAKLAKRPVGGFRPDAVTARGAVDAVRLLPEWSEFKTFSKPQEVVYFGEGDFDAWITPIRAWKLLGTASDGRQYNFFVDASSGELAFARSEIYFADVTGSVAAKVTPGSGADTAANPPVVRSLTDIRVTSGATNAFTDATGAFTLALTGAGPVNVSTSLVGGRWATTASPQEPTTPILSDTDSSLIPGTVSLTLNDTPSEFTTAQANGFYFQTLTHNYFKGLAPSWTGLDISLTVNVNLNNSGGITDCNAFFGSNSTNFFIAGGGCNNTASGSVVSHEYGHFIVNRLGLAQGAFGEGFGDTMSMLMFDDAVIGRNFTTTGGVVRLPDSANTQYPCSGTEVHFCGQILGGVLWEIRKAYGLFHGSAPGLAIVRQQHADWAQITAGGQGTASAHPTTAIEWLTIDDDNADFDDGTPNYTRLASSFAQHSITVPARAQIDIDLPDGLPRTIRTGITQPIRVRIEAVTLTPNPSTAKVFYRQGASGAFTESLLTPNGTVNEYRALVPGNECGELQYFFSVQSTTGVQVTSPAGAPATTYTIDVGTHVPVLADDFELANAGWTTSEEASGTGTLSGQWVRDVPVGTAVQPGVDHSANGTRCWFTGQGAPNGAVGAADVDNGRVILTSPAFDLSGSTDGQVHYWLWYSNNGGASPNLDLFTTEVSPDNGATWIACDIVGPNTDSFVGWNARDVDLASVPGLVLGSQMRLRFIADDAAPGSVVEAAIDDLVVDRPACTACLADLDDGNGTGIPDGGVNISDLLYFVARFEAGVPAVDLDDDGDPAQAIPDGGVDINDLLFYLAHFEGGC